MHHPERVEDLEPILACFIIKIILLFTNLVNLKPITYLMSAFVVSITNLEYAAAVSPVSKVHLGHFETSTPPSKLRLTCKSYTELEILLYAFTKPF
jgi:hypothetical protein